MATLPKEVDVIVVGGGVAGLCSAVSAAEENASVLVVEKEKELGGTTALAIGSITAAQTSIQKSANVTDSVDAFFEDLLKAAENLGLKDRCEREFLKTYATQAGESLEWLRKLGLVFYGPSGEFPHRVPRMHNVIPSSLAYINILRNKALEYRVQILTNAKVSKLIRENKDGRIMGVEIESPATRCTQVLANKGVILAGGGFSSSYRLKEQFIGRRVAKVEGINPNATGECIQIGIDVNADTKNMDLLIWAPELRFVPYSGEIISSSLSTGFFPKIIGAILRIAPDFLIRKQITKLASVYTSPSRKIFEAGAILVAKDGRRFVDELEDPRTVALECNEQVERQAYILFDSKLAKKFTTWPYYVSTFPGIAYAYIQDYEKYRKDIFHKSESLKLIAGELGCDEATLKETINKSNERITNESDRGLGTELVKLKLDTAPFYYLGPLKAYITVTEGGLRINTDCQVIDKKGMIVTGLYAVGDNSAGPLNVSHGMHIGWAVVSGRTAGRNAARF